VKFVDEFRDPAAARALVRLLHATVTRPWTLMEICGGQTHTIMKSGLAGLLPEGVELVHGPGCPVCVTPVALIDAAVEIASRPEVLFTSFGDMVRVPGSSSSLLEARAHGADVRIVYSPLDALSLARDNPQRQVVFFAVGFETTAPGNAMAVWQAARLGLGNFSVLVAHVLVPPAIEGILSADGNRVQGFLAPGHVCTVEGTRAYENLSSQWGVPVVVTGFEPVDLLEGILLCVRQLEAGRAEVENQYSRAVASEGNPAAQRLVAEVFEVTDREWRGLGIIPRGGLRLREAYSRFDALERFGLGSPARPESGECLSGLVLLGRLKPPQCPAFGIRCTPETPLGAPMVSSEGACSAYYRYGRQLAEV
jgi:hydrogenase expression/formation protein HypD